MWAHGAGFESPNAMLICSFSPMSLHFISWAHRGLLNGRVLRVMYAQGVPYIPNAIITTRDVRYDTIPLPLPTTSDLVCWMLLLQRTKCIMERKLASWKTKCCIITTRILFVLDHWIEGLSVFRARSNAQPRGSPSNKARKTISSGLESQRCTR